MATIESLVNRFPLLCVKLIHTVAAKAVQCMFNFLSSRNVMIFIWIQLP